ncbi:MAG: nucleotidyltransferase domain-containing protein [Cyanobacteria bacterium P01_F01_bin.143]
MSVKFTPREIAMYRAAAKQKWQESKPERIQKQKRAWELARSAALLLKEQFKATKVMIFGSLVRNNCFTLWSDVDIAAWGIAPHETLRAMEAVRDLDEIIEVNLVDIETCNPALLANIEQEGVLL